MLIERWCRQRNEGVSGGKKEPAHSERVVGKRCLGHDNLCISVDNKASKRIADFCKESLHEKSEVPDELMAFLTDWWTNHILHEDMKYKAFFEEKDVK